MPKARTLSGIEADFSGGDVYFKWVEGLSENAVILSAPKIQIRIRNNIATQKRPLYLRVRSGSGDHYAYANTFVLSQDPYTHWDEWYTFTANFSGSGAPSESARSAYWGYILQYGLLASTREGWPDGVASATVTSVAATISFTEYPEYITPRAQSPVGNVGKSSTLVLGWSEDAEDDTDIKETKIEIRASGKVVSTVNVSPVYAKSYTVSIPSAAFNAASFEWRVGIRSPANKWAYSDWTVCTWVAPQMSVGDLSPTGKTYKGFQTTFRWKLSTDATGIYQTAAKVEYRLKGQSKANLVGNVSGSADTLKVGGDVLPVGEYEWHVVISTNSGFSVTSAWQSCTNTEVPISIDNMYPDASGRAPSKVKNRFGWTFVADAGGAPGGVTQTSAMFYWRPAGQGAYKSVSVPGGLQYVDIPAGTLPFKGNIDWYVQVTASTGTKATSQTLTVSTVDTLSTPVAVSPAGAFLDDSVQGITFTWRHVNATGTGQTGYELSYSEDSGASYAVLQEAEGATSSWSSQPKRFALASIYWRIRTKNSDGVLGNYSLPAIFAVRRNPDAPTIISFDQKPLPSIAWQSDTQTGYEVEVDGASYGMVYGTGKTWRSPSLLADGTHTIRVRIINQYRDVSAWSSVKINVKNVPRSDVQLSLEEQWGQVRAMWSLPEGYSAVCLIRDKALIFVGKEVAGQYLDRTSVGTHAYTLRAFDVDGNYTDSTPMMAAPRVPYAAIGLLDGEGWTLLKYSKTMDRYSCSHTQKGSFVQFYGVPKPVWRPIGSQEVVHTLSYAKKRGESLQPLLDMRGQTVVYKDYEGHLAVGTFDTVELGGGRIVSVGMKITETYQKELDYAGV